LFNCIDILFSPNKGFFPVVSMIDSLTLKNYYAMSCNWERDFVRNLDKVLGMTRYEARVLIHLHRNKGSYMIRIMRLLKLKRSTAFYILERFSNLKVVFSEDSPISGNKVYKLADSSLTRAYLSAAFKLCICEQLKEGANENEIFT